MSRMMSLGLQLMAYGLGGVFLVLALIIVTIWLLVRVFPVKEGRES